MLSVSWSTSIGIKFFGEKNGNETGKKLNTVPNDVEREINEL